MPLLYFVLLLSCLVFFHELGHFLVAKLSGVKVLTFSIGFGPAIIKKRFGETEYRFALIPLGGYVKMYGDEPDFDPAAGKRVGKAAEREEPEAEPGPKEDAHRAFNARPLWQRTLIVLAGPVFNLILPFIIYLLVFLTHTDMVPATIGEAIDGGPAAEAGVESGDLVTAIDGKPIRYWWELEEIISRSPDKDLEITLDRDGNSRTATVHVEGRDQMKLQQMNLVDREGRIQIVPIHARPEVWVRSGSQAQRAGLSTFDRVVDVDGRDVVSFAQFYRAISDGSAHKVTILKNEPAGEAGHVRLGLLSKETEIELPAGAHLDIASAQMAVYDVEPGSPAADLGLSRGDRIVTLDGFGFPFWYLMEVHLQQFVEEKHKLTWENESGLHQTEFSLLPSTEKGDFNEERQVVVFGGYNYAGYGAPAPIPNEDRLAYAAHFTWVETLDAYRITLYSVAGLVGGKVPLKEMGGPILIYDMASKTTEYGWEYFFRMMVWLSLSLGFINLFPVPILDGGHLMFFAIEAIIRRPIPIRVREIATLVGLVLIVLLMIVVFKNDIVRSWGGWFGGL